MINRVKLKMKIKDLLKEQDNITEKNQLAYQAIIKRHLKKNGLNREKDNELKEQLGKHAQKLVNEALNLGAKWLE